jgi:hypothetical protein
MRPQWPTTKNGITVPFTLKSVEFITSVFDLKQLPKERLPEIASISWKRS